MPVALPRSARPPRPTAAEEDAIHERDGYRCRYCGCRVALRAARAVLTARYPEAVPWPRTNRGMHGAFYALNACADHVVPHSLGGDKSPANLVTACWTCNNGKADFTLEELGIADPRERPPVVDDWDGLRRIGGK